MKTRVAVLAVLFSAVLAVPASAQGYYQPTYTQRAMSESVTAPIFVENQTGGLLNVVFEINGVLWPVKVADGNWVPDLMVPVDARMRVKKAKALVYENRGTREEDVKYCHYRSQARRQKGWYFYRGRSTGPCEK